jgi:ribonuclease P protein component
MAPDGQQSVDSAPPAGPGTKEPLDQRFLRAAHIRRRRDFLAVYDRGTRLSGSLMTVFFLPNSLGRARLGIAATRKIGSAVIRNRAKRRVRDVFRREPLSEAFDIVVIPRRELVDAPLVRLESEFRGILNRHRRSGRGR